MTSTKMITNLEKQNSGMYNSLIARNIFVERTIKSDMNDELMLETLQTENGMLKELIKQHKPAPIVKEKKAPVPKQEKKKKDNNEEGEEEENHKEPEKKINTIMNLEDVKRAFFTDELETFETLINDCPLKMFRASYKYSSDKDGAPTFSATNLQSGFVRACFNYSKYFMICFRCWKSVTENKYNYDSLWLLNMNEPLSDVIGSLSEDFTFTEIIDKNTFINEIKKLNENTISNDYECIAESYVH